MSANNEPSSNKATGSTNTWSSRASALQQTTTRHHSSSSCQVTRAVQTMSLYHNSTYSILPILRQTFYSKKHFPKILGCIMMASGVAGYKCMGWYTERAIEQRKRVYIDAYHHNNTNGVELEESNNNRLVSLARKMTHRVALASSGSQQLETNKLQRQVTKFW